MHKVKRILISFICLITLVGCIGCDTGKGGKSEPIKLTWYVEKFPHVGKVASSFADTELYRELMERCNVKIEFIHPSGGVSMEALKAMSDLPDIIEGDFRMYPGGVQAAIDDGTIIELDDYLEQYSPEYLNVLEAHPEWDKDVTTDSGAHYTYANIRGDEYLLYWWGPIVRKDLLEKLNLKVPVTVDDWEVMLNVFRENGVRYPISFEKGEMFRCCLMSAFGVGESFYQIGGNVKYAPLEAGYLEYITMLKRWYDNGLIDPEFFSHSEEMLEYKVKNGDVGAFIGSAGGNMGKCIPGLRLIGGSLMGVSIPVLNEGDSVFQSTRDSYYQPFTSVSISGDCKNIEAAARLLNYGYTQEGHMLYNFGIEGVSYQMKDGYPYYTDIITNNPKGLSMQHAMSIYMSSAYGGPFVQDKREYEQYLLNPEQMEATQEWSKAKQDHRIPKGAVAIGVEKEEQIINNYANEQSIKFVVGERSLEEYEQFVAEIKELGVEKVINAMQEALKRYNNKQ